MIIPDQPFDLRFNNESFKVNYMTIYRPSPVRVENVQADAVLSLNDYHTAPSHVVLIPLSSSNTFGAAGNFVDRIMQNIQGLDADDKPLAVSVGNDWSLTNVLSAAQDSQGRNVVRVPFFKWNTNELVETQLRKIGNTEWYGWRPRPGTGTTTIMLKDPVPISLLTMTYLQLLPYVPSSAGAPNPPPYYVYQKGKCLTCANKPKVDPAKLEELRVKEASEGLNPLLIVQVIFGIIAGAVALIGIYYGLDWAMSGTGQSAIGGVLMAVRWLIMPKPKPAAQ